MDVGAELRLARERRRLSLSDLSDRTKIGATALSAIENNDIARLPPRIFMRGFVKAYAREVGLDPDELAARYTAQFDIDAPPMESGAGHDQDERHESREALARAMAFAADQRDALAWIAGLIVVAAIIAFGRSDHPADVSQRTPSGAGDTAIADGPAARRDAGSARDERGTIGAVDSAQRPVDGKDQRLRVELVATGDCWISATADGTRVLYRSLHAGELQKIDAQSEIVLRVGDPVKLTLSINGTKARTLGPAGQAVSVTLTPANYRQFLTNASF